MSSRWQAGGSLGQSLDPPSSNAPQVHRRVTVMRNPDVHPLTDAAIVVVVVVVVVDRVAKLVLSFSEQLFLCEMRS